MRHLILLGDSIFDNARYVPGEPALIEQLRGLLPAGDRATLLVVDGHTTQDIPAQLAHLPGDATHLVISCGGNDALLQIDRLGQSVLTVHDALEELARMRQAFEASYQDMLGQVLSTGLPTTLCTIYEAIPGLSPAHHAVLCLFNDVILREALRHRLSVIDLRLLCDQEEDYSLISPIEPSATGGEKIVRAISALTADDPSPHPFSMKVVTAVAQDSPDDKGRLIEQDRAAKETVPVTEIEALPAPKPGFQVSFANILRLLPEAVAWAEREAVRVLAEGNALGEWEQGLARAAGVAHPERIRVALHTEIPVPDHAELRAEARSLGLLGPGTQGLALGYAIWISRAKLDAGMLAHECCHTAQFEQAGSMEAFLYEYLKQMLEHGYWDAPFERGARERASMVLQETSQVMDEKETTHG